MSGEPVTRTRMPADVDAPDRVLWGLTFRQLAIISAASAVCYGAWRVLDGVMPVPVLLGAGAVAGGLITGLALGRRDGVGLDVWLAAAMRFHRSRRALSVTDTDVVLPGWVQAPPMRGPLPAPLRLPADSIDADGQIGLPGGRAAVVAATTVNLGLRTDDEQAALVDVFGRWLNSLSSPAQIVVSAQPADLGSHARALADAAPGLAHAALSAAAADHAAFLADLTRTRDPLRRQVLIVHRDDGPDSGGHPARRRAQDTVRALSGLGVTARALDGPAVTAALAAAADPFRPPRPGGLAAPDAVITGPARAALPRRSRR